MKSWPPPPSTHHLGGTKAGHPPRHGYILQEHGGKSGMSWQSRSIAEGQVLDMKERRSQRWALTYGKEMWP